MAPRTPAVERICTAALAHFAERGYDGGSLNDIASAVGIRKPSLYTHFAGKDELFLTVYDEVLQAERQAAAASFATERDDELPGLRYCADLLSRYAPLGPLRLLLRTAYFPPAPLYDTVTNGYEHYLDELQAGFVTRLHAWRAARGETCAAVDAAAYSQAYLGIVDSLHVELVYTGGRRFDDRLIAFQRLLGDSLNTRTGAAS